MLLIVSRFETTIQSLGSFLVRLSSCVSTGVGGEGGGERVGERDRGRRGAADYYAEVLGTKLGATVPVKTLFQWMSPLGSKIQGRRPEKGGGGA